MPIISINGNVLNPENQGPVLRAFGLESEDASKSNYILIQTKELLEDEQEDELERLGVDIQEYVSQKTYLCCYKPSDLAAIRSLPFVAWANVYMDMFVVQSSMKSASTPNAVAGFAKAVPKSSRRRMVDVVLHHDVDPTSQEIQEALCMATRADTSSMNIGAKKVRMMVQDQHLDEVAAIDGVRSIHEVHAAVLFNNKAVPIIKGDADTSGDHPIGAAEAKDKVSAVPYEGEGQIVAVGDTGFDKGSTTDTHPAFKGRVKHLYALGRTDRSDDPDGHGTHVCGSVLGDGTSEKMGCKIQGTAPKATLVLQSLLDSQNGLGGIPDDLMKLFIQPYEEQGARIHTNSWGSNAPGRQLPYNINSEEIDRFVWEHQDMVILFAAGNAGIDADQDGINDRTRLARRRGQELHHGWSLARMTGQTLRRRMRRASRTSPHAGPTKERTHQAGRVAPGTSILSTRSSKLLKPSTTFGTSADPAWFFNGGTSMATPLVAGGVALIREALVKSGNKSPSAALIKAMLINGAVELPGQYVPSEAGPSPNSSSGYGRVNLKNSIPQSTKDEEPTGGYREGGPLTQGQTDSELVIKVPKDGERTLKVTLVWTDPAGESLQNDLDLIVTAADGSERHGNMGDKKEFDRANNVEQVVWAKVPGGDVKVQVRAFHIFKRQFAQRFAVAWSLN
ncbi:subtilisin-like protease [Trichophyton tonsurans CBS 112818]|uniref:Subtilisin-like protease n=1 Tax=Trichophyton tonsurans (strain CBS 112818) TaxID=647933 RepID=F2RP90_TRIT1|nr:subtilisin-like protease [Trichophyton tonsurans CBS 112818]